jgi:hypothetical protein
MNDAGRLGLGGNNPPEPTPLELAEQLIPACDEWTAKGALTTADEARVLGEFLVQIREAHAMVKAGAVVDRKPHLDALAAIIATVKPLMEPHEKALEEIGARAVRLQTRLEVAIERIRGSKKVTGLLADWLSREQDRLRDEAEAKRKAAEDAAREAERASDRAAIDGTIDSTVAAEEMAQAADEAAAAARKAPTRARVRGDLQPRAVALHDYYSAKIIDWVLARRHYRTNPKVKQAYDDAVEAAANDEARRVKDVTKAPPGVEFLKREQVQ